MNDETKFNTDSVKKVAVKFGGLEKNAELCTRFSEEGRGEAGKTASRSEKAAELLNVAKW